MNLIYIYSNGATKRYTTEETSEYITTLLINK